MPEIDIPASFKKTAKKKDPKLQRAIAKCVELLADNPKHPGLHTHPMQGFKNIWEAYIDDGNRVTFHRDGDKIVLRKNCNHDILRRP